MRQVGPDGEYGTTLLLSLGGNKFRETQGRLRPLPPTVSSPHLSMGVITRIADPQQLILLAGMTLMLSADMTYRTRNIWLGKLAKDTLGVGKMNRAVIDLMRTIELYMDSYEEFQRERDQMRPVDRSRTRREEKFCRLVWTPPGRKAKGPPPQYLYEVYNDVSRNGVLLNRTVGEAVVKFKKSGITFTLPGQEELQVRWLRLHRRIGSTTRFIDESS